MLYGALYSGIAKIAKTFSFFIQIHRNWLYCRNAMHDEALKLGKCTCQNIGQILSWHRKYPLRIMAMQSTAWENGSYGYRYGCEHGHQCCDLYLYTTRIEGKNKVCLYGSSNFKKYIQTCKVARRLLFYTSNRFCALGSGQVINDRIFDTIKYMFNIRDGETEMVFISHWNQCQISF